MIDHIKDRIGIDWSATRPQASEDVKQSRGQKLSVGTAFWKEENP